MIIFIKTLSELNHNFKLLIHWRYEFFKTISENQQFQQRYWNKEHILTYRQKPMKAYHNINLALVHPKIPAYAGGSTRSHNNWENYRAC
jgi:hypothetical protein